MGPRVCSEPKVLEEHAEGPGEEEAPTTDEEVGLPVVATTKVAGPEKTKVKGKDAAAAAKVVKKKAEPKGKRAEAKRLAAALKKLDMSLGCSKCRRSRGVGCGRCRRLAVDDLGLSYAEIFRKASKLP